jgi:hypothetical protein
MIPPNLVGRSTPLSVVRDPDSSSTDTGYRDLQSNTKMAFSGTVQDYGDQLKPIQNDLVNAGYYPSNDYTTEVDGKFGPKTNAAVTQLQSDLTAAGLFKGDASGAVDGKLATALAQLKQKGVPQGVSPEIAARLQKFTQSAGAAPAPMRSNDTSAFTPGASNKPAVSLNPQGQPVNATGQDQGEDRIQKMITVLGNAVDMNAIAGPDGKVTQAAYQHAVAQLASSLASQPNTRETLAMIGKDKLGFDPMKNSEAEVDNFLSLVSKQLDAAPTTPGAQTAAPAGDAGAAAPAQTGISDQQATAGITNVLKQLLTPGQLAQQGVQVNTQSYNTALASIARQLKEQPNSREVLSQIGAKALGFDPTQLSEQKIDNLLGQVQDQLTKAAAPAAPATPSYQQTMGSPSVQNLTGILGSFIDPNQLPQPVTQQSYFQTIAQEAGTLRNSGQAQQWLAQNVGAQALGFDPMKATPAQIDNLLMQVQSFAMQRGAGIPVQQQAGAVTGPATGAPAQQAPAQQASPQLTATMNAFRSVFTASGMSMQGGAANNNNYYTWLAQNAAQLQNSPDPRAAFMQIAAQPGPMGRANLMGFNAMQFSDAQFRQLLQQARAQFVAQSGQPDQAQNYNALNNNGLNNGFATIK